MRKADFGKYIAQAVGLPGLVVRLEQFEQSRQHRRLCHRESKQRGANHLPLGIVQNGRPLDNFPDRVGHYAIVGKL